MTIKASKHNFIHSSLTVIHTTTQFTQHNARHNTTDENRLRYVLTACHSTDAHTILMTASLRVLLLESETDEF